MRPPFVPTARLVALAAIPTALALAAAFLPGLLAPMFAADALLLVVALGDAAWGRRPLVTITRDRPRVLSVGRDNPVVIELTSRARRPLRVQVKDDLPDGLSSPDLPLTVTLPARGSLPAGYRVRPERRGAFVLGDHHVRYPTPLGLWLRQLRQPRRDDVRVYPDVRSVRTYELLARQNRETLLARAARLRGGENEFERLRDQRRDDAFRTIDWKATARRQKLTVREYQQERDQSVVCLLDTGRLMTGMAGGLSYLDHALNAALMMGHVAARSGDQIGLVAFDRVVRAFLPPQGGPRASQRLIQATYDLHPQLVETDFAVAFEVVARRLRKRALLVLFTQIVDDVAAAELLHVVRGLPGRHLPVCVLLRDPALEQMVEERGAPDDSSLYLRGAAAEAILWRDRQVRALRTAGAHVLHATPAELTPALVNRYLEIKAKQLL